VSTKRREAALVAAFRDVLGSLPDIASAGREARYRNLPGWTRPPGGVDVFADLSDGAGRLLCELKVDKSQEALWDALKLADICLANLDVRSA
jgi:hypothetical protein